MGCKAGPKILVRKVVGPSREAIAAASAVAVVIFFFLQMDIMCLPNGLLNSSVYAHR